MYDKIGLKKQNKDSSLPELAWQTYNLGNKGQANPSWHANPQLRLWDRDNMIEKKTKKITKRFFLKKPISNDEIEKENK
jgi:hypothetical protein